MRIMKHYKTMAAAFFLWLLLVAGLSAYGLYLIYFN